MKRILIIGNCGAGKSSLARQLHKALGLPLIHLDRLFWKPGWVQADRDAFNAEVLAVLQTSEWIMDGTYASTLNKRLEQADAVVFLDLPLRVCFFRVLRRVIIHYGRTRPDCGEGCPERFDLEFLKFVLSFKKDRLPGLLESLAAVPAHKIHHVRTQQEVDALFCKLTGNIQSQT